jgi:hypothetical protein
MRAKREQATYLNEAWRNGRRGIWWGERAHAVGSAAAVRLVKSPSRRWRGNFLVGGDGAVLPPGPNPRDEGCTPTPILTAEGGGSWCERRRRALTYGSWCGGRTQATVEARVAGGHSTSRPFLHNPWAGLFPRPSS